MTYARQILSLDLARKTGWALGLVTDTKPQSGSLQITNSDSSHAKLFSCWREYLRDFLSLHPQIGLVIFESPLPPMLRTGNTNISSIRLLMGLAAVTEELLYTLNQWSPHPAIDVREARVADVRTHFIGSNRHKRPEAKMLTIKRCQQLGWEPRDDNAADALALWDYQCSILRRENLFNRVR